MRSRLHGRVAFVTGASSGIGRAAALALARAGARVAVSGRDRGRLEHTADAIRDAAGEVLALVADVRDEQAMNQAVEQILHRFGRVDIHIASAGRGGGTGGRLPRAVVQMSASEWDEVIDTNLKGVFLSNRAVLPAMIRQGAGCILNVSSSRGAIHGKPYAAAYCASKHGLMGLTRALAQEVRAHGIRVLAVLPDATDTPLIDGADGTAPNGKMPAGVVADLMVEMIVQAEDALWVDPLIAPFGPSAASAASAPPGRTAAPLQPA